MIIAWFVFISNIHLREIANGLIMGLWERDLNKETYPGYCEISGGAIDYGEDIEKAVREEDWEKLNRYIRKYIGPEENN